MQKQQIAKGLTRAQGPEPYKMKKKDTTTLGNPFLPDYLKYSAHLPIPTLHLIFILTTPIFLIQLNQLPHQVSKTPTSHPQAPQCIAR
jgi:hypothetical protein